MGRARSGGFIPPDASTGEPRLAAVERPREGVARRAEDAAAALGGHAVPGQTPPDRQLKTITPSDRRISIETGRSQGVNASCIQ